MWGACSGAGWRAQGKARSSPPGGGACSWGQTGGVPRQKSPPRPRVFRGAVSTTIASIRRHPEAFRLVDSTMRRALLRRVLMAKALAAMGMVVVSIDFRQSPQHRYPDSVADVNFAFRWLRANASKFNASPRIVGALGSSSGGHLVLLNGMRPSEPRYAALPLPGFSPDSASPDYI